MRAVTTAAVIALVACSDTLAPIGIREPYLLSRVNGQPMPWAVPDQTGTPTESKITEGWITFINDHVAERHEKFGRWELLPDGSDSIPLFASWTQTADYRRVQGAVILSYHFFQPGTLGPDQAVDTLFVANGGLLLRQTGLIPPLDSMVRLFCANSAC